MQLFPLRFFPETPKFDFMGKRWWGFAFSITVTLITLGIVFGKGLNLGIDFTGGVLMEVRTEQPADLAVLRESLDKLELGEHTLQNIGSDRDVMIRVQLNEGQDQAVIVGQVKEALTATLKAVPEYRNIEFVGPTVGRELMRAGVIATLLSFAGILFYLWFRFEWQYGTGGVISLAHDTIMMIGFFALTRFEFGLTAVAAVLTIIGYSINDSVVIYDRIRENLRKYKKMPFEELINLSMNETLSRTIMTSLTTLSAAMALALFGGEVLRGFSWSLVFGIVVGTYSSIYISAPALIYLHARRDPAQLVTEKP